MKRIVIALASALVSIFFACEAWPISPLDAGKFSLYRSINGKEFTSLLSNYARFADAYVNVTSDSDLSPCVGWNSFTKISPTHIDMCTTANKLGYSIQVISQFRATALTDSRCLAKMNFALQIMTGTRPNLLPDNVRKVQTEFCLNPGGRVVTYNSFIEEGPSKGLLFPFIAMEFKKLIPDLIKSVQTMAQ